jgi:hypothetical protein
MGTRGSFTGMVQLYNCQALQNTTCVKYQYAVMLHDTHAADTGAIGRPDQLCERLRGVDACPGIARLVS